MLCVYICVEYLILDLNWLVVLAIVALRFSSWTKKHGGKHEWNWNMNESPLDLEQLISGLGIIWFGSYQSIHELPITSIPLNISNHVYFEITYSRTVEHETWVRLEYKLYAIYRKKCQNIFWNDENLSGW